MDIIRLEQHSWEGRMQMKQLQVTEQEIKMPEIDNHSANTQQELLALLGKKRKSSFKKYWLVAVLVILLLAVLWLGVCPAK